jgi:hypothetical protein
MKEFLEALNKPVYATGRQGRMAKILLMRMNEFDSLEGGLLYTSLYSEVDLSVEHVAPQNPGGKWDALIKKDPERYRENVNRLGNLVLLSGRKNSAAKNYGFQDKKDRIFSRRNRQGTTNNIPLTDSLMHVSDWTFEVQEERQRKAVSLCREI